MVGGELAEISYTVRWQTVNYAALFLMTWTWTNCLTRTARSSTASPTNWRQLMPFATVRDVQHRGSTLSVVQCATSVTIWNVVTDEHTILPTADFGWNLRNVALGCIGRRRSSTGLIDWCSAAARHRSSVPCHPCLDVSVMSPDLPSVAPTVLQHSLSRKLTMSGMIPLGCHHHR